MPATTTGIGRRLSIILPALLVAVSGLWLVAPASPLGARASAAADPTPTPLPSPTIAPSPTVAPSPTIAPSPTLAPSPTVAPSPTLAPSPTIAPSPTLAPSPTFAPSPAPRPSPPAPHLSSTPATPRGGAAPGAPTPGSQQSSAPAPSVAKQATKTLTHATASVAQAITGVVHAAVNPKETLAKTERAVTGLVRAAGTERRSLLRVLSDYSMTFRLAVLASLGILVFAGTALVQTLLYRRRGVSGG